jgi:hypothetical protein
MVRNRMPGGVRGDGGDPVTYSMLYNGGVMQNCLHSTIFTGVKKERYAY